MNKVIIFGHKSFLQKNLFFFLKKKKIKVIKKKFSEYNSTKINIGDIVINCSINNEFFYNKYKKSNDRNLILCNFFKNKNILFIMLSTRMVYKPHLKINENSKIKPINTYAKNYIKSEKNCKKIMNNNILILRLSNIIGIDNGKKQRLSMLNKILLGIKKKIIVLDNSYNYFKDILPIRFFCKYLLIIIRKKITGIVNVGSGQSFTLLQLSKILVKNKPDISIQLNKNIISQDSSYKYDIKKLYKITKLKFTKNDVFKEIIKIKKQCL